MSLRIIANYQELDVPQDQIFTLTRAIAGFFNEIKGSYTKTLTLPITERNAKALDSFHILQSQSKVPYIQVPTVVILNGIQIIPDGIGVVEDPIKETTFNFTVDFGNSAFWSRIDDTSIQSINLKSLNFVWNVANWAARINNGSGVVTSVLDYGEDEYYNAITADLLVNKATASVYIDDIFEGLTEDQGFKFAKTSRAAIDESRVVLPMNNGPRVSFYDQDEKDGLWNKTINQSFTGGTVTVTFNTPPIKGDVAGNYDGSTYTPNKPFKSEWIISLNVWTSNFQPDDRIVFHIHSSSVATNEKDIYLGQVTEGGTVSVPISSRFAVEFDAYPEHDYRIEASFISGGGGGTRTVNISGGTFEIIASEYAAGPFYGLDGSTIDVARSLPDIPQRQFIKEYLALFNYGFNTPPTAKEVEIFNFDKVLENNPQIMDAFLDESIEAETDPRVPYGKINVFEYAENGDLAKDDDFFLIRDLNVNTNTTVLLSSIFANSFDLYLPNAGEITARIVLNRVVEEEGRGLASNGNNQNTITVSGGTFSNARVGDLIFYTERWWEVLSADIQPTSGGGQTILTVDRPISRQATDQPYLLYRLEDVTGNPPLLQFTRSVSGTFELTDGLNTQVVNDYKVNNFDLQDLGGESLSMSNIIQQNYRNSQKWLNHYKKLKVYMQFDLATFLQLDLKRPVYLSKYDTNFFILNIDRWRQDRSFAVELLALRVGLFNQVLESFTNVDFDSFNAKGNLIIAKTSSASTLQSNTFGVVAREEYELSYFLDISSGAAPRVRVYEGAIPVSANSYELSQGTHLFPEENLLISNTSAGAFLQLDVDGASEFSLEIFLMKVDSTANVAPFDATVTLNSITQNTSTYSCNVCDTVTNLTLNISGGTGEYQYQIDGGPWIDYTGPFNYTGTGTIDILARDTQTLVVSNQESTTITAKAPNPLDLTETNQSFSPIGCNKRWLVTYSATGGCGGHEINIDGGPWFALVGPVEFSAPGLFTIGHRDKCGNVGAGTLSTIVDQSLPQPTANDITTVFNPDNNCIRDWDIRFNISGGSSPYTVSLNGGPYLVVGANPVVVNTLQEGNNTIQIRDLCNTESIVYNVDVGTQALATPSITSVTVLRQEPPSGNLLVRLIYNAGTGTTQYRYKFDTQLTFPVSWANIVPDDGDFTFTTNENSAPGNPASVEVEIRDLCLATDNDSGAIPPPPATPTAYNAIANHVLGVSGSNSCDQFDFDFPPPTYATLWDLAGGTSLGNGVQLSTSPTSFIPPTIGINWWAWFDDQFTPKSSFSMTNGVISNYQTCP